MRIATTCFLLAAGVLHAQQPCESLTSLSLPRITITSAVSVSPGTFNLPGGNRTMEAPAFCRVIARAWPEINFELWMPANWNGKFLGVGNGGLAGTINYGAMVSPIQTGYATGSTDTGHLASEASWPLGHFERVVDFGHRAIHVMTQADKAILKAFYGRDPAHYYFDGCSNGGRQAFMEAQRYPEDYDGIVAGDPAYDWSRLYSGGHIWTLHALDGDSYIPASKTSVIADAVNRACDANDGIKDGVLNDPRRCHFDPASIQCSGADRPDCLTAAQVAGARKLWEGARTANGDQIFPGLMPGGEDGPGGWSQWITGTQQGSGGHAGLGIPGMRYIVFEDPSWDYRSFKYEAPKGFDSDVALVDLKAGPHLNATDPDLRAFQARGGKLLHYHGWSDPDISALASIRYYEKAAQIIGGDSVNAYRNTSDFYRLFLVPGMQHCGGGPGPNAFSMVSALEQWVEKDIAPERIVAAHATNGKVDRTRPLCSYPKEARYKGTGSTDLAENFSCELPSAP